MSRPIVLTSPMDGSPQVVCFDTTTLWHLDAAEWAPSTASKAENLDLSIRCPLCPRKRTPIFGFYERPSQNAGPRGGRACEGDRSRCHGVIFCPSGTTWGHHETSPPQILASGSGRCRTPRRAALCLGANLSIASDHDDRAFRPGRVDGRDWTGHGRGNADDAWSTRHR